MNDEQPLIDAHHHLWALDGSVNYPWLEETPVNGFFLGDYRAIRQPFLVEDLQALIPKGYRLVGSVHCEAEADRTQAAQETSWVTKTHERHGLPTAHIGWAAFGSSECAAQLDIQMMASSLLRGVRSKPTTSSTPDKASNIRGAKGTLQDRQWLQGLAFLAERGLSWDLRVPAWHLAEAADTLEGFSGLQVILNHTGLPWDRTPKGLATWRSGMRALAANPDVAVKLSELGTPWHDWDLNANLDLLCETLEMFGPARCLFASNFPVSGLKIAYIDWLALVENAINKVVPGSRQAVLHDNAMQWYRLTNCR